MTKYNSKSRFSHFPEYEAVRKLVYQKYERMGVRVPCNGNGFHSKSNGNGHKSNGNGRKSS